MFYVYMLASKPYGTLYIGTTSDLARRVWEHKNKVVPGFTKRDIASVNSHGSKLTNRATRHCSVKNKSRNGSGTERST
jgi:predicted GIY-YIG superfamily endonuclease